MNTMQKLVKVIFNAALTLTVAGAGISSADPLDLADVPLFLGGQVKPNIILAVDDSGSMDSEVLLPTNDGALWWNTARKSFIGFDQLGNWSDDNVANGVVNFNVQGGANNTWKKYTYLFPNGTGTGRRVYNDSNHNHYGIAPLPEFAYVRSPTYNTAYFNPAELYLPWPDYDAVTFGQIDPEDAPSDPVRGTYTFDLTAQIESENDNYTFRMFKGATIPAGTRYKYKNEGAWATAAANVTIGGANDYSYKNVAISYYPATFYLPAATPLPSDFGWDTGATTLLGYGPDGGELTGYEIRANNFVDSAHYDAALNNFANWFSYYRKRHLATRGGIVSAFQDITGLRVGSFKISQNNGGNAQGLTMRDFDLESDRDSFYATILGYAGSGGTPNRQSLKRIGEEYENTSSIIEYACQKNFGVLFTDGYSTTWTSAGVGNADSNDGAPYADDVSNTIADIGRYYFENNLRPDYEAGLVPLRPDCDRTAAQGGTIDQGPLNCNPNPHMVTYGVVLDREGYVFEADLACTEDPYALACNGGDGPDWPTAALVNDTRSASMIDDLWHAAVNSHGAMLNAKTPKDVKAKFEQVLRELSAETGASSAVAVNSGSISSDESVNNYIFQARFNSGFWTGELRSFEINPNGSIGAQLWNSADVVPTQNWQARQIITSNTASGQGVRFHSDNWGDLADEQKLALRLNPYTATLESNTIGRRRIKYLRGKNNESFLENNGFRSRNNILGDFVHSAPAYVGAPNSVFPDLWDDLSEDHDSDGLGSDVDPGNRPAHPENAKPFSTFRFAYEDRQRIVYVGGNDGMIHGFNAGNGRDYAGDGKEVFAYVPGQVFPRLSWLTIPEYSHYYYVDGSVTYMDAFFNGDWHTVLGSGLGKGGQGIFMLDITDPTQLNNAESNAGAIALWEFDDGDHRDLGYNYYQTVNVIRLHDEKWYAVFGNGYNNTERDDLDLDGDGTPACGTDVLDDADNDADDGPCKVSKTGNAVLYFVDLATGTLVHVIDTEAGMAGDSTKSPNGLSAVAPVDLDGDFIVDVIYGGDLYGNLWRFDVTSDNPLNWSVAYTDGVDPAPLFVARDPDNGHPQPITERPQVGTYVAGQTTGVMVYFGTGKYFELGDNLIDVNNPADTQTFYGIWDKNYYLDAQGHPWPETVPKKPDVAASAILEDGKSNPPFERSHLLTQEVLAEPVAHGLHWRLTSNHPISWHTGDGDPALGSHLGWYLDLNNPANGNLGERSITDPILRGRKRIIFTTLIPSDDPCKFGGSGWLMELDIVNGGSLLFPPFDVDGNGTYGLEDLFDGPSDSDGNPTKIAPSGVLIVQGIPSKPAIVDLGGKGEEGKFVNTSRGEIEIIFESSAGDVGRQTWRQIQ